MSELIVAIVLVLFASGICSGIEAALFSLPLIKARQLAQSNRKTALALLSIRENMSRPIATIVILNNVANVGGSIWVGSLAASVFGSEWLGLFSAFLSALVIFFSEGIPKTLGECYPVRPALFAALPLKWLTFLLTPVLWCFERFTAPLVRREKPVIDRSEILWLARLGRQEGIIHASESEMIQRVLHLSDVRASDHMTPRVALTYLPGHQTLLEAREKIISSQHSRILVIENSIDEVLGIALKDELLKALIEMENWQDVPISRFVHEVRIIPEGERADRLLAMFLKTHQHLTVVVDEFGGVSGVITLEDVLEILTGEIVDETDTTVDLQAAARKKRESMGIEN